MTAPTPDETAGTAGPPELMVPREVAAYFRVKPNTVLEWLGRNDVFPNAFKIGGSWRIPREDVKDYALRLRGDRDGLLAPKTRSGSRRKR